MANSKVDIAGLDKAELLIKLWMNSKNASFFANTRTPPPLPPTLEDARSELILNSYVDYFRGRTIKTNFESELIDPFGFDRDNGTNCFAKIVENMRSHSSKSRHQNDDIKERNQKPELTPMNVANWAHGAGFLGPDGQDQVTAMKDFTEGKMTYAEMRGLCG